MRRCITQPQDLLSGGTVASRDIVGIAWTGALPVPAELSQVEHECRKIGTSYS